MITWLAVVFNLAWAEDGRLSPSLACWQTLSSPTAQFYTTADGGESSVTTYLNLLELTLQGIDEAEATALTHIARDDLKFQILQALSNHQVAVDPIAEVQKIAPDLITHSPQLTAIVIIEPFAAIINDLTASDWQKIHQAIKQKLKQQQNIRDKQDKAKPVAEEDYLDVPDHNGEVRLHRLIREQKYDVALNFVQGTLITIRYLNTRNKNGDSPLEILNLPETHPLYTAMRDKGALNKQELFNIDTEFFQAVRTGKMDDMENLFSKGADLEGIDQMGRTPLFLAINRIQNGAVLKLLKLGANINKAVLHVDSLIDYAITSGLSEPTLKAMLLAQPSDLQQKGELWIHGLVRRRHVEAVDLLLEMGVDPHGIPHDEQQRVAHLAISMSNDFCPEAFRILRVLAKHNYNFELPDRDGLTPLQFARTLKHGLLANELIRLGAKP